MYHIINHLLSQILISLNQYYDGTIYVIRRTTKILAVMNILKEVIVLDYKYNQKPNYFQISRHHFLYS